jgi:hypothetical protein
VAGTIKLKKACTLHHQANLGEEVSEVKLEEGEELTVLAEWQRSYLARSRSGKLFNVGKDLVERVD